MMERVLTGVSTWGDDETCKDMVCSSPMIISRLCCGSGFLLAGWTEADSGEAGQPYAQHPHSAQTMTRSRPAGQNSPISTAWAITPA
jgi:hypothetical protein